MWTKGEGNPALPEGYTAWPTHIPKLFDGAFMKDSYMVVVFYVSKQGCGIPSSLLFGKPSTNLDRAPVFGVGGEAQLYS